MPDEPSHNDTEPPAVELWPSRRDMMIDINHVWGTTYTGTEQPMIWKRDGAPIPRKGAVPKVEFLLWLTKKLRQDKTEAAKQAQELNAEEKKARIRVLNNKAKKDNAEWWNRDDASKAVLQAAEAIKRRLYTDLVHAAYEEARKLTPDEWEQWLQQELDEAFQAVERLDG